MEVSWLACLDSCGRPRPHGVESDPEVLSMVDGVGGMVHVSVRFCCGPGRSRSFTTQSLTTRLMGGVGGNDFSEQYPAPVNNHPPRLGLHSTNTPHRQQPPRQVERTHASWKVMSPNPEKDGWFAHHQHRPCCEEACTVCLRGISNPRLVALVPHRERLQGSEMRPRAHVYGCHACSTFSSASNRFGFDRGPREDSVGVVHPNRHRLRLGNSTGVHHCQINDSRSGASQLHLPCGEFHTRGPWRVHPCVMVPTRVPRPTRTGFHSKVGYPLPLRLARFPRLPCPSAHARLTPTR